MSRFGTLRKWVRSRTSSILIAIKASKATVDGSRRAEYPETADDQHSSEMTPSEPPHSPADTWSSASSVTLRDPEEELAYDDNGVPYSQDEIRKRVKETADYYVRCVCAQASDAPEAFRDFTYYASRLEGEEDLGILECPNAMSDEDSMARSAAWTIHEFEGCPTRDVALEYLLSENINRPSLVQGLITTIQGYRKPFRPSDEYSRSTVQQARTGRGQ
jgi:hypothetical protein